MKQYLNDPQQEVLLTGAKDTIVCGGRGIGKGVIHAAWNLRNMQRMVGSITGIVAPNGKRALTNTLPSMLMHWENWGYKRGYHWVIGRKPPKSFGKPIFTPDNYENIISFYNGSIGLIISQDRTGTSNSLSLDAVDVDEAKLIKYEQLKEETLQANRGNQQHFGDRYYHHSKLITSDMPVTKAGSWFMNYQDKCDPELIEVIQGIVLTIWQKKQEIRKTIAAGKIPPAYLKKYLRDMNKKLCQLRSRAVFYKEYSSIWNMQVLGEAWVNQMKRDLPPLTFQTSILCKRIGIAKDGFYSCMTKNHQYDATNFSHLDNLEYNFKRIGAAGAQADNDVLPNAPLCIAFDYNSNINWLVCGQPNKSRLNVLKSFFVKFERKLPELVADFCEYYKDHKYKKVIFYYDSTALGSNYAVNNEDFKFVIVQKFRQLGWMVKTEYIGRPMNHMEKQLLINRMFRSEVRLTPYFNRENNQDLLLSIETAGVRNGKKDKSGEKLAETEENLLEHRTDGSDAFDTLAIGCERFPNAHRYIVT